MDYLTAVNRVIRGAGESAVEVLDNTHPLQAQAISMLDETSQLEQNQGWWFNSYSTTLQPDGITGIITVPAGTVKLLPYDNYDDQLILRGTTVFDKYNRTTNIARAVPALLVEQWDFEDLPETFATWIAAKAEFNIAKAFNADSTRLQTLAMAVADAKVPMHKEHVQHSRVNMLDNPSMVGKLGPAWYGRYQWGMR